MKNGMVRILFVLSILAVFLLTAVFDLSAPGFINANIPPVVTDESNGQVVTMKLGSTAEVRLHEQVHCGYTWAVNLTDGLLMESDSSFPVFPEECMGMVPNPKGMHRFVIRATRPGVQQMQCMYGTPSMPNVALSRFNLTINVIGPELKNINKSSDKNENETKK